MQHIRLAKRLLIRHSKIKTERAWESYTYGAAACELFFEDDENRFLRTSNTQRQLFGRRFKRIGQKIADVVKKVAKVVVKVVETVVDVVKEVVECGVGIVQDGPKCGLVGCAFGLVGAALDVAFTAATGGLNKAASLACDGVAELAQDTKDEDSRDKKQKSVVTNLQGIGGAVCAINEKLDSPVLNKVCEFHEKIQNSALEVAFDIVQSETIVLRFVETFTEAMCGSPGSAVLDLLEEVVVCGIGCAKDSNAFCPAGSSFPLDKDEEENEGTKEDNNEIDNGADKDKDENQQETGQGVPYETHAGKACRTASGGRGSEGDEYIKIDVGTENECEDLCTQRRDCQAFEYSKNRCEVWEILPARFDSNAGFSCNIKTF